MNHYSLAINELTSKRRFVAVAACSPPAAPVSADALAVGGCGAPSYTLPYSLLLLVSCAAPVGPALPAGDIDDCDDSRSAVS